MALISTYFSTLYNRGLGFLCFNNRKKYGSSNVFKCQLRNTPEKSIAMIFIVHESESSSHCPLIIAVSVPSHYIESNFQIAFEYT